MEDLKKFKKSKLESSSLQKLWGGKKIATTTADTDPAGSKYSDTWNDLDNDGKWSSGDTITLTKLEEE